MPRRGRREKVSDKNPPRRQQSGCLRSLSGTSQHGRREQILPCELQFFLKKRKKKHLVVEEDMALVTSVQPMNNRTTNTAGCWGTLQLLHRVGKLTMVAHESISIWVGIWEFQSDPPALRLLHQRRVDTTCVFCGSCPSPALSADPSRLCLNATGMSFTFSG